MDTWTVDLAQVFKVAVLVSGGLLTIFGLVKLLLGAVRRTAMRFATEIVDAHGVECPVKREVMALLTGEHSDFMTMFTREQTERLEGRKNLAMEFSAQLVQLEKRINERLDHLKELMDVLVDGRGRR